MADLAAAEEALPAPGFAPLFVVGFGCAFAAGLAALAAFFAAASFAAAFSFRRSSSTALGGKLPSSVKWRRSITLKVSSCLESATRYPQASSNDFVPV